MKVDIFEEQQDKAFRLLEALSDIDEELLVRSEQAGKPKTVTIPLWKYGSVVAACFILLVLGTGAYGFGRLVFGGVGSVGPVNLESIAENVYNAPDSAGAAAQMNGQNEVADTTYEGAGETQKDSGGILSEDIEEESASRQGSAAVVTEKQMESAIKDTADEKNNSIQDAQNRLSSIVDSSEGAADLTLEAAKRLAVVGAYVPEKMPEGYQFTSAISWAVPEGHHSLSLSYVDAAGSEHIVLKMTDYYMMGEKLDVPEGTAVSTPANMVIFYHVIPADQVTEETFRTEDKVAVIYDGDMIVQFDSNVDSETLYQVFTAIQP